MITSSSGGVSTPTPQDHEEPVFSERQITHVIPDDGFDHEPANCTCRPEIFESASMASDMDLPDTVEANPGDLTFMHKRLGEENGRFQIAREVSDD